MKKAKQRTFQDILDSDDELTVDFIEAPYVPAYQDDTRFEYLSELIKKGKDNLKVDRHTDISKKPRQVKNVMKGIFNKKDTLCFQSVQKIQSDAFLLWFFEFLLYKDLQSSYKFLKPCLVPKYYIK